MKISDIIIILLFILPGVICEKISYAMDLPSREKRSEFNELINGIVCSFPIVMLSGLIFCLREHIKSINQFINKLNDVSFLVQFTLLIIGLSIIIGMCRGLFSGVITFLINKIREFLNKIPIDNKCCWRKFILDNSESQYIEIIINGESHKGFLESTSLPNEEKEIILSRLDTWQYYPEIESKLTRIKRTYINIEKNIIIKDYDITDYDNYCDELNKKFKS